MPDITKCNNEKCSLKEKCWRWISKPSQYGQSYNKFEQDDKGKCNYFWEMEVKERKLK